MIVKGILGENPSELIKLQVVNLNFLPDFLVRTTITKKKIESLSPRINDLITDVIALFYISL